MEKKPCTKCNTETHIREVHKKYAESEKYNIKRVSNRYYVFKDQTSNQPKIYYQKIENKTFKQQKPKNMHFKNLVKTGVDLDYRLKALEDKRAKFHLTM